MGTNSERENMLMNNALYLVLFALDKTSSDHIDKTIFELEIKRRDVYYKGKLHKRNN